MARDVFTSHQKGKNDYANYSEKNDAHTIFLYVYKKASCEIAKTISLAGNNSENTLTFCNIYIIRVFNRTETR